MHNIEQIKLQLAQLPLDNRISVLGALKVNIEEEFERMASQILKEDLAICEQRLAELDAGRPRLSHGKTFLAEYSAPQ